MRLAVAIASLLLMGSALLDSASADVDGSRFRSSEWRVEISAPQNWQLSERTAYPSVLLRMVRRAPDGKMLLGAERLVPGTDAAQYAQRTRVLLTKMGFKVRAPQLHSSSGAYLIDSERDGAYLRQAFLVAGGIGYSLTLAADSRRIRSQHLRAFDLALSSVRLLGEAEARAIAEEEESEAQDEPADGKETEQDTKDQPAGNGP